ncbi:hypothetical protein P6U16_23970 (plasmid) [Rhizobium sp. 32-5/1]|nr:hypothetical protein [Rhizobium sp. 32-5/1]WEZ86000.1 hypothetical protein P6U16_23970 [Rhizobium sp. 32-5/1]
MAVDAWHDLAVAPVAMTAATPLAARWSRMRSRECAKVDNPREPL